jgi:uncharacterized membrane protein YbhN (UPF0104 family)
MDNPQNLNLKRLYRIAPALFSIVLFGISVWAIYGQLHQYHLRDIVQSVGAIPIDQVLLASGFMLLNGVVMTCYDALAIRYMRQSLAYRRTALAAILSSVISNNVGFALLANSALRYRFYSGWGLSAVQVASLTAFCNLSYGLGQMTVGGVVFVMEPIAIPKLLPLPISLHLLGVGCLCVVAIYLIFSALSHRSFSLWKWKIPHLPLKVSLVQIVISSLDWMLAAAILYVLLPFPTLLSYPAFLGIYLLAQAAGIVSNVPGGLGVFETAMLLLLSPVVKSSSLIGALLAFRGIYYLFPLMLSVLVFGLYEVRRKRTELAQKL